MQRASSVCRRWRPFALPSLVTCQARVFEDVVGGTLAPDAQQDILVHQIGEITANGLGADIRAEPLVLAVSDPALMDHVSQRLLLPLAKPKVLPTA